MAKVSATARVLFVDDESDNLDALRRLFRKDYECYFAQGGVEALKLLGAVPEIAVIVSDQRMPEMSGVEFLEKSLRMQPDAVRILVTGYTDIEAVIMAINDGRVYEYVSKPWEPQDFKNTVARAVEHFLLRHELKEKNQALETALHELENLDVAKTRFLALLSHELRTPLTTLQSYIEALEDPDPKDIKKFIGRLSEASTRLQHLVDDSLLFAQAQLKLLPGGTQQDPFQERTLRALIEDAKKRHKKSDLKATVHAAVSEDVSPPLVKNVLNVVLTKIADNAAKYAKAHVNVHVFDSPTQYHVIVSDDGPGIASDLKTALFRQWGDKADIAHHDKGLGLGLKTASLFLHGVGGSIRVLDAKKLPKPVQGPPPFLLAGACFHIEIPKPGSAPGLPKSP